MPLTQRFDSQVTVTTTYTVTQSNYLVLANGSFTVTMYTAVGNKGREAEIRNISASATITLAGAGAELIDSANTLAIPPGATARISSDGTQWWRLGTSSVPPFADPNFISVTDW